MLNDFKKFINKGNVIDMAVGLIMATYFGAIVQSLVNDIIMPPIGKLIGGVDFSNLKIIIQKAVPESAVGAADGVAEVAVYYGAFLNKIIVFIIVAFAIYQFVRVYTKFKEKWEKKEAEKPSAPAAPTKEEVLLTEIRDLLKNK